MATIHLMADAGLVYTSVKVEGKAETIYTKWRTAREANEMLIVVSADNRWQNGKYVFINPNGVLIICE